MTSRSVLILINLLLLFEVLSAQASYAPPVILSSDRESYPIGFQLDILIDPNKKLTINDVSTPPVSDQFKQTTQEIPNFSFRSPPVWVRFRVTNKQQKYKQWVLILKSPQIDHVDLYYRSPGGKFSLKRSGDFVPFKEWDFDYRYPSFSLSIPPSESVECYLRLESSTLIRVPLVLMSEKSFTVKVARDRVFFGFAIGALVIIVLYNMFFGLALRDRSYLYHLLSIASLGFFLASWEGWAYQYITGAWPGWNHLCAIAFMGMLHVWTLVFTRHFLKTGEYAPYLDKLTLAVICVGLVVVGVGFISYRLALMVFLANTTVWILLMLVLPVKTLIKGYRPALYYLAAYSVLYASAVYGMLVVLNVFQERGYAVIGAMLGLPITIVVLSMALAVRYNQLQGEYSRSLELEVDARTKELSSALVELEESQKRLYEGEQRYRMILKTAIDGFAMGDMTGRIIEVNDAGCEMSGYSREELIGMNVIQLETNESPEELAAHMRKVFTEGYDRFETTHKAKDGSLVPTEMSVQFVPIDNGRFVTFFRDITERKQAEKKLAEALETAEQLRDEAQAANRAKSEFVANMSHEIRTPLNAIMGMTGLALRTALNPKLRDYLTKIHASSQSLLRIVNDILDFSKIEAGRLDLESVRFDLRNIISNMSDVVCASDACSDIEFLISVDPDIPFRLIGDPLRLEQVLTNLASNAVKFTPSGEVLVKVERVEPTQNGVNLKFSVRDTGIGIPAEQIPRLFSSFTQADGSMTRRFGGSGLGLTICKRLIDMMGGDIQVQSEAGKGSIFWFQIHFGVQPEAEGDRFETPSDMRGMRVLVVDDNETSQEILLTMLKSFSFEASAVGSGEEALDVLVTAQQEKPYDLILLDWKMTGIDGIETARRIDEEERLWGRVPKIIMITAFGTEEVKRQAEEAGLDGFLSKPVQPSMLLDIIMEVFEKTSPSVSTREKAHIREAIEAKRIRGARVLVAEDNEINQQVAKEILNYAGVAVQIAWNGKEAVEAVNKSEFDVVLMDIQMPEMDGYEATRVLRSDGRFENLPIIAMTAHAMAGDREKCLEAGMNDHVAKPVNTSSLISVLSKWIRPKEQAEGVQITGDRVSSFKPGEDLPSSVPGIDIRSALKRLEGNRSLLKKFLRDFEEKYADISDQIRQALEKGSTDEAERLAHSMKGVAGAISANSLHLAATDLERGIKQADPDTYQNFLESFDLALAEVLSSIKDLLVRELKVESEDRIEFETPESLDMAQVRPLLMELAQLIKNFDVSARKCFKSLKPLLSHHVDSYDLGLLERSIEMYKYAEASPILKRITDQLGSDLS